MTLSVRKLEALEKLGADLAKEGWKANRGIAEPYSTEFLQTLSENVKLALSFLAQFDGPLKSAICHAGRVKPQIAAAADASTLLTSILAATEDIPSDFGNLANALCQIGLNEFCSSNTPDDDSGMVLAK